MAQQYNGFAGVKTVRNISLPEIDLALGDYPGMEPGLKFGRNSDIDTGSVPEDVWNGGNVYTGQPLSFTPETVDVFSGDANDTSAGTGARTLRLWGLKTEASTEYETEDIIFDGTSAVTSADTWWRVNRAKVLTAGSGGENAGVITIQATTTDTNVFAKIPAGYNQTQIAAYTVPAGKKAIWKSFRAAITRTSGAAGSATVTVRVREPDGVFWAARTLELQTGSARDFTEFAGDVWLAGTDIKVRVEDVSDNNTVIDSSFGYILIG